MRYISFNGDQYGVERDGQAWAVDAGLRRHLPSLRDAIAADALDDVAANARPVAAINDVRLDPPIPNPGKIICVGLNYEKIYPVDVAPPAKPMEPIAFARFSDTFVGHDASLRCPPGATTYDYEGEIVAVIETRADRVSQAQAMDHVFGYSVMNEGSVRAVQKQSLHAGKNFYRSGAWGPWIVPKDMCDDPDQMVLKTHVNGELRQETTGDQMIFSLPKVIEYLSHIAPLNPGDIIATGSPDGSGGSFAPTKFLGRGDVVSVTVSGFGTLSNRVT